MRKRKSCAHCLAFSNILSKNYIGSLIPTDELCIRDAAREEELAKCLLQEIPGHKLALSAKTVSKNLNSLQEQEQQIRSMHEEITALCARGLSPQVKTTIKQLKNCLTELKLAQDRLRKSVAGLTTS